MKSRVFLNLEFIRLSMIYPGLVYLPPPQSLYFLSLVLAAYMPEEREATTGTQIKLGVFLAFEVLGFGLKVA